jgi:enoyl-CoA hydratase/carnithine racemase
MDHEPLYHQVERDGAIIIWKFHNPPQNLMNMEIMTELSQLIEDFDRIPELSVGIWTSATPGLFIQHFDVSIILEWGRGLSLLSREDAAQQLDQLPPPRGLSAWTTKPVICAINGPAEGAGCEMALGCDFRFISRNAFMSQPEVSSGFPPGGGGTQYLARLLGTSRALELCLTGRRVYGDEAERLGLVTRACNPDELMPTVMAFARELAEMPVAGVRNAKKAIYEGLDMTLRDGMIRERELFFESIQDPAALEIMTLYVELGQDREKGPGLIRERLKMSNEQ